MPHELYRTQLDLRFRSQAITTTFYWDVDNTLAVPSFRVGSAIHDSLVSDTPWFLNFMGMISHRAYFRRMETQLIRPVWGPTIYYVPPLGPVEGLWLNDLDEVFSTANLKWNVDGDSSGKHQVRVGPIGRTAFEGNSFHFTFVTAALMFISEHITPRLLDVGLPCLAAINHQTTGGSPIVGGSLYPFPGRQRNRRWRP